VTKIVVEKRMVIIFYRLVLDVRTSDGQLLRTVACDTETRAHAPSQRHNVRRYIIKARKTQQYPLATTLAKRMKINRSSYAKRYRGELSWGARESFRRVRFENNKQ